MIAIVAALEQEIRGIRKSKSKSKSMNLSSNENRIFLLSGMGRKRTTQALNLLFQSHRPSAVISTGFAGALREELQLGEIVLGQKIFHLPRDEQGQLELGEELLTDPKLLEQAINLLEELCLPYHLGAILTASKIITEAEEKRQLGQLMRLHLRLATFQKPPAIAVDMESYWVAQAALAYGIPFIVTRVILDTTDETLPPLSRLVDEEGRLKGLRALTYFGTYPWKLRSLIKLARNSKKAEESLAKFVLPLAVKIESFLNLKEVS